MKDSLEMLLFNIVKIIVLALPIKLRYQIAEMFGVLFYFLIKKRRVLTYSNLKLAFPEMDQKELKRVAIASYKNITKTFFEILWVEEILKNREIENLEILTKAFSKERGVILLSLHLDNWEIGGGMLAREGFPVYAVAKKQRNKAFNKMVNETRERSGLKIIQAGKNSAKDLIKTLKTHSMLGLIADQHSDDIKVKFFGKETGAYEGPAFLGLRFDAPIVLLYSVRNSDNSHTVHIDKEIELIRTGDNKRDIEVNTQNFINEMERVIVKYKEQWFWQHRRWRD